MNNSINTIGTFTRVVDVEIMGNVRPVDVDSVYDTLEQERIDNEYYALLRADKILTNIKANDITKAIIAAVIMVCGILI